MNIGWSSRLGYDGCFYKEHLEESTGPLLYRLNPNYNENCDACLSTFGPRSGFNGYGVSTVTDKKRFAPAQELVDLESILSNRNVLQSKCRIGHTNPIDVTKFSVNNARVCNNELDPLSSRLTYPAANYRSMSIDRFYDLPKNPQSVIFWNFATNTRLEASDNMIENIPDVKTYDPAMPREVKNRNCNNTCGTSCPSDCTSVYRPSRKMLS